MLVGNVSLITDSYRANRLVSSGPPALSEIIRVFSYDFSRRSLGVSAISQLSAVGIVDCLILNQDRNGSILAKLLSLCQTCKIRIIRTHPNYLPTTKDRGEGGRL